ncbi:MAG: choice-of-anchor D domain-containing protein [Archangiaceae bacterium]|nr:choice-of-anchor D domain-containing protein [Archangiaceae bacterium]
MRRLSSLLAVLWGVGCTGTPPVTTPDPPGLVADPPRLAYLCVTPGCEESQTLEVLVRGKRRAAIKRVLLSGGGSSDFSFTPSETPPFIVGGGSAFTVDVKYTPRGAPAPGEAKLLVTYTDASPDESPDRLPPGELVIPLVRRIVGEPFLTVRPGAVQFGVVAVGDAGVKSVRVANEGFGNLVLEIASVDAGHPEFSVTLPQVPAMGPDAGFELPIAFRPVGEHYVRSTVAVYATAEEVPPAYVSVEGTSLSRPRFALEAAGDVDFGLLQRTKTRSIDRQIVNQGGVDLELRGITVTDPSRDVKVLMPMLLADAGMPVVLRPLQRLPLSVLVDGQDAGEVDAKISFTTNDPATPVYDWRVRGTVTEPKAQVSPATVNFGNRLADGGIGNVPVGWVITRPVEVTNVGFGPLTVKNISLVAGGSTQFSVSAPTLPAVLERNGRLGVEVQFTGATVATFDADLSVETDDAAKFSYAHLHAGVGMCGATTCPIANGTSSCTTGTCQIGTCNAGYYDTDGLAASGCECKEVSGNDPGPFCADKNHLGNFSDSGSGTQYTGLIALQSDVDLITFTGEDNTQFLSDDYDVKVRLDSADPGIRMCVYRNDGRNLPGSCFFSNESCPSNRSYRDNDTGIGDDSSDYIVKVFRDPQSAPTCTPYTLFISNAR